MRLIDFDAVREDFMVSVYAACIDEPDNLKANSIIDAFDELPVEIEMRNNWIPVTERLPKTGAIVLATLHVESFDPVELLECAYDGKPYAVRAFRQTCTVKRRDGGWELAAFQSNVSKEELVKLKEIDQIISDDGTIGDGKVCYIYAWMPLPEPYKPEGNKS